MSLEFTLTTVEQMESDTARLKETAEKVGIDVWQDRVKNQTPHCGFGEKGICCRICAIVPLSPTDNG